MKNIIPVFFLLLSLGFTNYANGNTIVNNDSKAISITSFEMESYTDAISSLNNSEVICSCSWWSWAWGNNNCLASNGGNRCDMGANCQASNANCGGTNPEDGELTPDQN